VRGNSLGIARQDISILRVGGSECSEIVFNSSHEVACLGAQATWTGSNVEIAVGGQVGIGKNIFMFIPPPQVESVSPTTGTTLGGEQVHVFGKGLGAVANDLLSIRIGGIRCLSHEYVNPTEVICTTPPGVGSNFEVAVEIQFLGISAGGPLFSYSRPEVLRASILRSHLSSNSTTPVPISLATYAFGGEPSIDVVFLASEVGNITSIAMAGKAWNASGYLEDATGSGWQSPCQSIEKAQGIEQDWSVAFGPAELANSANELFLCRNASLLESFRFSGHVRLRLIVEHQLDLILPDATANTLIAIDGYPTLERVLVEGQVSGVVPTEGMGNASIMPVPVMGSNLGRAAEDVLEVLVGDTSAPSFEWVDSTEI